MRNPQAELHYPISQVRRGGPGRPGHPPRVLQRHSSVTLSRCSLHVDTVCFPQCSRSVSHGTIRASGVTGWCLPAHALGPSHTGLRPFPTHPRASMSSGLGSAPLASRPSSRTRLFQEVFHDAAQVGSAPLRVFPGAPQPLHVTVCPRAATSESCSGPRLAGSAGAARVAPVWHGHCVSASVLRKRA